MMRDVGHGNSCTCEVCCEQRGWGRPRVVQPGAKPVLQAPSAVDKSVEKVDKLRGGSRGEPSKLDALRALFPVDA
jgi:hypothetical protein